MLLLSVAFAEPTPEPTWLTPPPTTNRIVQISAASWDPKSRALIDRLLEHPHGFEIVALTMQDAAAWSSVTADRPALHVATTTLQDPGYHDGVLGQVTVLEQGKRRWESPAHATPEQIEAALTALERGDRKALKKLPNLPPAPVFAGPERFTGSVNEAIGAMKGGVLMAPPGTRSFNRVGLEPVSQVADRTKPMVVYGTEAETPLLTEILAHHGIQVTPTGVQLGDRWFEVEDPRLIAALPNPWNPAVPVVIYVAATPYDKPLNAVFHGPTQATLTSATGDSVSAFALEFDAGTLVGPAIGPATLTGAELAEDLRALGDTMQAHYSGLPALEWTTGEPWSARSQRFAAEAEAQASWTWREAFELITKRYLEPVQDFHFTVRGDGPDGPAQARLVRILRPWFTDLRVVDPTELGIAVVPTPDAVQPGVPYAFPTLTADGTPRFLVGVFAAEQPESLVLDEVPHALHRSRSALTGSNQPWAYDAAGPIPVVSARTMMEPAMQGFAEATKGVREHDRLVLDVRGNHGGSDTHAHTFVFALDPHAYRGGGAADLGPDGTWASWGLSRMQVAGERWGGKRLWVLADGATASSGETFVFMGSQVANAVVVGLPTAGCTENGNLEPQRRLPHSKLQATFGHTRFIWNDVRPVVEGIGTFPDIWLDEADPIGFLAGLP